MNKSEMLAKLQAHGVKISGDKILVANLAEAIEVLSAKNQIKEYELTFEEYEEVDLGRAVFSIEEERPSADEAFEAGLNFSGDKPLIKIQIEGQRQYYFLDTPKNRKKIEKASNGQTVVEPKDKPESQQLMMTPRLQQAIERERRGNRRR